MGVVLQSSREIVLDHQKYRDVFPLRWKTPSGSLLSPASRVFYLKVPERDAEPFHELSLHPLEFQEQKGRKPDRDLSLRTRFR